jgi:Tfp pilus assembly protein PilX
MNLVLKAGSIINNQRGSVITMALIFLALLTIMGIATTNSSTTEVKVSTNAVLHNVAFYAADSGIAAGRAALNAVKRANAGNWDLLLRNRTVNPAHAQEVITWKGTDCTTLDEIISADGGRTVGPATFTLQLEDNDDLDGRPEVDSDNTVILTATLESPYRNSTATIRATVRGTGDAFSQEHYDAASSGNASTETAAAATVQRY